MQPAPQAAPQDEGTVVEMPARLKRQIVSYQTREAPGTIIIDTPNTYLYYVLAGGQAIRYGIGVGRDGFTWSGGAVGDQEGGVAGLDAAAGNDRAPALSCRGQMPAAPAIRWGARAMYLGGTIYPDPRHQRAADHRHPSVVGLHPPHQ